MSCLPWCLPMLTESLSIMAFCFDPKYASISISVASVIRMVQCCKYPLSLLSQAMDENGSSTSGNHSLFMRTLATRSGQVWEHVPEQSITASTFRRYSRGHRLAIPQADAWPIPISLRCRPTCCNHEARGRPIGLLHSRGSLAERIW